MQEVSTLIFMYTGMGCIMHFQKVVKAQGEPQTSLIPCSKALQQCWWILQSSCRPFLDYWSTSSTQLSLSSKDQTSNSSHFSRQTVCNSGEAEGWTVAVSLCLYAWQSSSQPSLCSHQEMSFSNPFSNALNSSLLSSNKAKSKRDSLLAVAATSRALAVFLCLALT